jgi:hypothetical protein
MGARTDDVPTALVADAAPPPVLLEFQVSLLVSKSPSRPRRARVFSSA